MRTPLVRCVDSGRVASVDDWEPLGTRGRNNPCPFEQWSVAANELFSLHWVDDGAARPVNRKHLIAPTLAPSTREDAETAIHNMIEKPWIGPAQLCGCLGTF